MIEQETLFILGAGASVPYKYPTGKGLRIFICHELLKQYQNIINVPSGHLKKSEAFVAMEQFIDKFEKSSIPSIDQYLACNPTLINIGKKAIVLSILIHEKRSRLRERIEDPMQDWYSLLYGKMIEGFSSPDSFKQFKGNKVSFITFNYDRSLEHFIYESFINSFSENKDIQLFISSSVNPEDNLIPFPFIHVYGQVEDIEFKGGHSYGLAPDLDRVNRLRKNIRVIGERTEGQERQITELFNKAEKIFFLGFGYAYENLGVLKIPKFKSSEKEIYGTAKDYTKKEIYSVEKKLKKHITAIHTAPDNPIIQDMDCYQLLREYL